MEENITRGKREWHEESKMGGSWIKIAKFFLRITQIIPVLKYF